jgi:hypothetical protein
MTRLPSSQQRLLFSLLLLLLHFPTVSSWQILSPKAASPSSTRRQALLHLLPIATRTTALITILTTSAPPPAKARAPGSKDIAESVTQIQDAVVALQALLQNWDQYATIDAEGRAGSTDAARRILGGIAPQAGRTAIEVAQKTPLYRMDGAFHAIRQQAAALEEEDSSWLGALDLPRFEELVERILFALQKADGDFYS